MSVFLGRLAVILMWVGLLYFMGAPDWAAWLGGMVVGYLVMPAKAAP